MRVVCFCGTEFEGEGTQAVCPLCSLPAELPNIDNDIAAMHSEVREILTDKKGGSNAQDGV